MERGLVLVVEDEPAIAELVVAESGQELEAPPGWEAVRSKRYGRTWVAFLRRLPGG